MVKLLVALRILDPFDGALHLPALGLVGSAVYVALAPGWVSLGALGVFAVLGALRTVDARVQVRELGARVSALEARLEAADLEKMRETLARVSNRGPRG